MAFIDDPEWLISHVRNCFITSDEFCERIIGQDEHWERVLNDLGTRKENIPAFGYGNSDDDATPSSSPLSSSPLNSPDAVLPNSFDIHFERNFGPSPRKTSLGGGVKVKKDKAAPPKQKNVAWRQGATDQIYDPASMGHLYEKKTIFDNEPVGAVDDEGDKKISSLSRLMAEVENMPADPFLEYAQFDGASHPGIPVKKINIFLMMCHGQERWKPIYTVVQCTTAKVSDLIGLICHHYVQQRKTPTLKNSTPEGYSLFIADDDGEVDDDIPPLDSREPISKFDFGTLALVEKDLPPDPPDIPTIITVNIPQRGWHKIQIDDENLLLKEILKIVLQRRRKKEGRGIEYVLERQSEPGKSIDLEMPLKEVGTQEFCLIRLNSKDERADDPQLQSSNDPPDFMLDIFPSLPDANRRYKVEVVKKFRANAEVHLDINGERLEVTPLTVGSVKPMFIEMQSLVHAEIVAEKASGKATFRVRYQPPGPADVKHVDFKCLSMIAREIVDRINAILDHRITSTRPIRTERRIEKRRSLLP